MLRSFDCVYDGKRYPVMASNHLAARSLGTRHIANVLGACEPSKVAVVDLEIAAGYKPARYLNVTEGLSHVVDIPHIGCTCDAGGSAGCPVHDEAVHVERRQREPQDVWQGKIDLLAAQLCICVAGHHGDNPSLCTCKSLDRAEWRLRNEAFDTKLANAHLDGLTDGR